MNLRLRASTLSLAIILPLVASSALAQSNASPYAVRTIEVDGHGETRTSPDVADLNLAIDTQARTEAIAIATRDARAQAQALASALDVKLGKVLKATTVAQQRPIPVMAGRAMAMAANVSTPVEPGEVAVPATVSLTFEIE
jgi:uncharacterized protein YggE